MNVNMCESALPPDPDNLYINMWCKPHYIYNHYLHLCIYLFSRPADIEDSEYNEFYKSFSRDHEDPLARTHFVAEGEVTFKSILFIPKSLPSV